MEDQVFFNAGSKYSLNILHNKDGGAKVTDHTEVLPVKKMPVIILGPVALGPAISRSPDD
jgi:hypothetical protein